MAATRAWSTWWCSTASGVSVRTEPTTCSEAPCSARPAKARTARSNPLWGWMNPMQQNTKPSGSSPNRALDAARSSLAFGVKWPPWSTTSTRSAGTPKSSIIIVRWFSTWTFTLAAARKMARGLRGCVEQRGGETALVLGRLDRLGGDGPAAVHLVQPDLHRGTAAERPGEGAAGDEAGDGRGGIGVEDVGVEVDDHPIEAGRQGSQGAVVASAAEGQVVVGRRGHGRHHLDVVAGAAQGAHLLHGVGPDPVAQRRVGRDDQDAIAHANSSRLASMRSSVSGHW